MIDYLSDYRTQDGFKKKHYYVSGALCWFECNQYGEPTGPVYYIKKIPDEKQLELDKRQRGYKKLLQHQKKKLTTKDLWIRERADVIEWKYEKPRYQQ